MPGIYVNSQGTELFSYGLKRSTGVADTYSDIVTVSPIFVQKTSVDPLTKRKQVLERLLVAGTRLSSISYNSRTDAFLFNIDLLRLDEINWGCSLEEINDIAVVPTSSTIPLYYIIGGVVNTYDREQFTTYVVTSGSQE